MKGRGKRTVFLVAGILGALVVLAKVSLYLLDILQPYRLPQSDWEIYQKNFISPEGRVIDTGNGNISHSEGQGYGMIIAAAYEDRKAFDRIWDWTQKNLQTRPSDKLLSWLWKPNESGGAVADPNNASDGDLLVAWALVRANRLWKDYRYEQAAAQILIDLARLDIKDGPDGPYLLPGTDGFVVEAPKTEEKPPLETGVPSGEDPAVAEAPEPEATPIVPDVSVPADGAAKSEEVAVSTPAEAAIDAPVVATNESASPVPMASPIVSASPTPEETPPPVSTPTPEAPETPGVTLNASYYIFPAFDEIAAAFPGTRWSELRAAGEVLVQKGSFGKWHLPPDWTKVTADGEFQISSKFPPEFGYNAVRVPLHLAWKNKSSPLLEPFAVYWKQFGAGTIPATVNLKDDVFGKDPALPGMRAIATLAIHCVDKRNLTVRAIPVLTKGEPYFSASLTLLTKIAVRETFAEK